MEPDKRENILKKLDLFAVLSDRQIQGLVKACSIRKYPKDSVLFMQDDPAETFYVVLSGSIAIMLVSSDGRELIIHEVRSGEFFGELAVMTQRRRSTMAVTREKSEILLLPAASILVLLDSAPALAQKFLALFAELLYASAERERALAFMAAPARLARTLCLLQQDADQAGYLTVSQEELARHTGLTRQTVAKILGQWRRAGWLITGRGRIVLLNLPALKRIERQALM